MSDLDFVANWDLDAFKRRCMEQRLLAEQYPAYDRRMGDVEDYYFQIGDWLMGFLLETWAKPMWHGSVSVLDVAYKLDSKLKVDVPRPKALWTENWNADHFAQARFLLAEMFGPIIRPGDQSQRALETIGALALHWHVPCGPERRHLH